MPDLSQKQKEYLKESNKRWNLKVGAVRSGKTFVDIYHIIPYYLRKYRNLPGLNVFIGVSRDTIERNILEPMREQFTDAIVGFINSRNIATVCGVPVYCLGAEKSSQIGKIQGSSIKYCYGDEMAKWNQGVFAMLQSRLDKPYSRFDGACNPEYPSHWLKEFIDNPSVDSYIQSYTIFDNPFLGENFIENLCKEYQGTVYYKRYILGEWTMAEGLIYPMYEDALEEMPDKQIADICLSIDYGTQNAFACIFWAKVDGVWYAVDEYYYSGRSEGIQKTDEEYLQDVIQFVKETIERYKTQTKRIADKEGKLYQKMQAIIDPSAASFIASLRKSGNFKVIPADNDVLDGIRETASALHNGLIKISPRMKNWQKEVSGYVWQEDAVEDRPLKEDDHCLVGETLVNTKNGEKPISELVGTSGEVWSYNTETGLAELKPYHDCRLTQEQAEIYEIETEGRRFIRCTGEHPILTERGYVSAKDLLVSDRIIDIMDSLSYDVD